MVSVGHHQLHLDQERGGLLGFHTSSCGVYSYMLASWVISSCRTVLLLEVFVTWALEVKKVVFGCCSGGGVVHSITDGRLKSHAPMPSKPACRQVLNLHSRGMRPRTLGTKLWRQVFNSSHDCHHQRPPRSNGVSRNSTTKHPSLKTLQSFD